MSHNAKVKLLQEQQKGLRKRKSSVPNLQMQQQALRKSLLLRKPISEDKRARIKRLQESQKVARDLYLQRKREEEKKKKVVSELARTNQRFAKKNLNNLFFPSIKKRK